MLHRAALSHCRAGAAHLRSFSSLLRLVASGAADAPRRLSRPTPPLPRHSLPFSSHASAVAAPSSIHARPNLPAPNRDKIILKGLVFFGRHGVHSAERQLGQKFVVDAELSADLALAGATGDLCDTIDYASAYTDIRNIMEGEPVQLLEALAARIVARLFAADSRVAAITIRIQKPHVAVRGPVEYLGIEISRTRPPAPPPSAPAPA